MGNDNSSAENENTPQDSELGQPPGNGHNLKRSPQKKSTEKSGGQDISDPLAAAVPLAESLSLSIPEPISPPGPGDDNRLASALDPCEHPLAVSAAFGNAVPVGAAELTAASTSEPDSCI